MKSIAETIRNKSGEVLNIYFTAGHPTKKDMVPIIKSLEESGADLIEIGMPYTDPLADGLTIQKSSEVALSQGIDLMWIFNQVKESRKETQIPIILMGYFNQLLQFGVEQFLEHASDSGVSGMIIPDLPMNIFESEYQNLFEKYGISISFLITPLTSENRIRQADRLSNGFIYVVSQTSITGNTSDVSEDQKAYYERIRAMNLSSPQLIGFGIHDHQSFQKACEYADGAIIGSAFIRAINKAENIKKTIHHFIKNIKK